MDKMQDDLASATNPEQLLKDYRKLLETQKTELEQLFFLLEQKNGEIKHLQETIHHKENELGLSVSNARKKQKESEKALSLIEQQKISLTQQIKRLKEGLEQQQAQYQRDLLFWQDALRSSAQELDRQSNRRILRLIDRLFNRSDISGQLPSNYQQLKDDSSIFNRGLRHYLLQPSPNLQNLPFLEYPVEFRRPNLKSVAIAPLLIVQPSSGYLGVEIVSSQNEIVTQSIIPGELLRGDEPVVFEFDPLPGSDQGTYIIRVFSRGLNAPVRIYEWRRYRWGGLAPLQRKTFFGYLFA